MKPIIPIFFTIDEGYAPWLSVALLSLKENASPDYQYEVHVIYDQVQEATRARFASLNSENFKITFIPMHEDLAKIQTWQQSNKLRADYFTLTIFFRIFLPDLFPLYDKAIYLDSDICVLGDISQLYNVNLGDNYLGVVNDYSIANIPELNHYVKDAVGVDKDHYFNSGILLMNFKAMREHHLATRFLELMNKYHFDTIAPDQDYLNALCKGKVVYLDPVWDAMPCDQEPFSDPKIIHYNLFDKPWCYDDVDYGDYFWEYAKKSPFYDEICAYKKNYSDEQKKKDQQSLRLLVEQGNSIPDKEVTMKKVFESGLEDRL